MSQSLTGSHHTQDSLQPRGHNRSHGNTTQPTPERGALKSSSASSPLNSSRGSGSGHKASILGSSKGGVEIHDGHFSNTKGHHFHVTNGNVTINAGDRRTSTKSYTQQMQRQSSMGSRTQDGDNAKPATSIKTVCKFSFILLCTVKCIYPHSRQRQVGPC
ncbi:hypothetical protein GALMADRAFT_1143231 [Galerina marginata CBS 339.88]|uniref:Uncharacterized protein n=1 Tax=Galerina marginata (strain CBS 339.88) TaxID=685588 RepID=A0A067S6W0_GALM3|nr:hypothetical protein GALMADRAFT_1143231 [Galerina marginata CBS 339.88]